MHILTLQCLLDYQDIIQSQPGQPRRSVSSIDLWSSSSSNLFLRFGQGIYTSSASNKYALLEWLNYKYLQCRRSASYSKSGIMFLAKVVLGKAHNVTAF